MSTATECAPAASFKDHMAVFSGFCGKADGKDRLMAVIQYSCMTICANQPGQILKIQGSIFAARKVLRLMKPLEALVPVLAAPGFNASSPHLLQAIGKFKYLLMATYFGADHFVWAHHIGLTANKGMADKAQMTSVLAWTLGSVLSVIEELWEILRASVERKDGESTADWEKRQADAKTALNHHIFMFWFAAIQAFTAAGLLGLMPFTTRMVGFCGTVASAMNCYLLVPAYPKPVAAIKPKAA